MFLLYIIGWWFVGLLSIFAIAVFINWADGSLLKIQLDHVIWASLGAFLGPIVTILLVVLLTLIGIGCAYEYTKNRYGEHIFTLDFRRNK